MIEFNNITFIYDNKPLMQHFSCCISSGEKVVLYGPSGHGKSTLLASVAGFVLPDEGSIRINGKILDSVAIQQIRRITAWLPQEFTLPFETVEELIAAPFRLKINQPSRPTKETILNHFARLGLEPELYEKRSIEISGGQRQRIMLMITALLNKSQDLRRYFSSYEKQALKKRLDEIKENPQNELIHKATEYIDTLFLMFIVAIS